MGREGFLHYSLDPFSERSRRQVTHALFLHLETFTLMAPTAVPKHLLEMNLGGRQAPQSPRSETSRYPTATTFSTPLQAWAEDATAHRNSRGYKDQVYWTFRVNFSSCPSP